MSDHNTKRRADIDKDLEQQAARFDRAAEQHEEMARLCNAPEGATAARRAAAQFRSTARYIRGED